MDWTTCSPREGRSCSTWRQTASGGDFIKAEMVKAFITSVEYRQRFGL
jgi:hypothetical protein